jgi:flavin reductase (DIM6/NTAB) family NADH-FMN oxidoreductase RutF
MKKSLGARTLAYPTPAWVIGTYDKEGRPNVMTAAWAGICCSQPPCVGVSLRKATYSYAALMERRAFTVNVPSEKYVAETDYFGIASGRDEDKFAVSGLTPVKSELVDAPYIAEFPIVLECRIIQVIEIGKHTQFIGEILDVKADEELLNEQGWPEVEKVKPIAWATTVRQYYAIGRYLGDGYAMGKGVGKR